MKALQFILDFVVTFLGSLMLAAALRELPSHVGGRAVFRVLAALRILDPEAGMREVSCRSLRCRFPVNQHVELHFGPFS